MVTDQRAAPAATRPLGQRLTPPGRSSRRPGL